LRGYATFAVVGTAIEYIKADKLGAVRAEPCFGTYVSATGW
jgi:hypothetical protein